MSKPDYSRYQALTVEKTADAVAIVTLNRPDRLNAVDAQLHTELTEIWGDLSVDYGINAIVLTGAGRAFCAGGDTGTMDGTEPYGAGYEHFDPMAILTAEARQLMQGMLAVEQPIIAAVNGDAAGLGASLALLCDLIVMADTARILDPHVRVAGDQADAALWQLALGPHLAKEHLFLGSKMTGARAAELGMVNYALPVAEVLPKALDLATRIAKEPPLAVRWTKVSANRLFKDSIDKVFDVSVPYELVTMRSADHREAVDAFLNRRPGVYTGR